MDEEALQELPSARLRRPARHGALRHCGEQVRLHRDTQARQRSCPQDRPAEGTRARFISWLGPIHFIVTVP